MKTLPLVLVLAAIVPAAADYPAVVLADEPIAYFRFEEDAGAVFAEDATGEGNDATDYASLGTGEIGVQGAIGKAVRFTGDGGIVTGLTLDPSTSDFSIEYLIKSEGFSATGSVVVSNQDGTGLGRSNAIYSATGAHTSFMGGAGANSGISSPLGDWRHVVVTYETSTATVRFFVDGLEGTPTVLSGLATPRAAEAADGAWVIGAHKLITTQFTIGLVDEVAIYDKRLDDPNGDGDVADSVIGGHVEAYLDETGLFRFETDRRYADSGEPVVLSWTTSPTMTELEIDNGVGDVLPLTAGTADGRAVGMFTVNPTETTTYTLSGTNPSESDTLEIEVIVDELPVIDLFASNLPDVIASQSVDFSWALTNADTASIDNGGGSLTTNPGGTSNGTTTVTVNSETTYTLTATNGAGSVTAEVTIGIRDGDPNLIAHWRVGEADGETDGTTLISDTGVTFDGTFVGTPTFDTADPAPVPGGSSASLSFPGDGASWVDVLGWTGIGGTQARTVAFWFKGPAPQTQNNATYVSWGTNATGQRFDTRQNGGASGIVRTEVAGSGSNGTAVIADDSWHHVAVVLADNGAPTIGEVQFYIDGVLDSLSVTGGTPVNTSTTVNVRLGASRTLANRTLTGKLDDIRIYDKALTPEEVLALIEGEEEEVRITSIVRNADGSVTLEWSGLPGKFYSVDFSLSLEEEAGVEHWLELDDSIASGEMTDASQAPTADTIFYRVRESD